MNPTLVLQSHTQPLPNTWLATCIDSVRSWSEVNKFDYQFIDDELFNYLSADLLEKTKSQRVIATDLARLKAIQDFLIQGYETVVWCDADFFIFSPREFKLSNENYSVGREVWIQQDKRDSQKLTAHIKVHNAFLMFRQGNSFLDFYENTAERLLSLNEGSMPPQFIGPKLLTAIHNIARCPVLETAGMLSPLVLKDIANQRGPALDLFRQRSPQRIAAANLCSSLYERGDITIEEIELSITYLRNITL